MTKIAAHRGLHIDGLQENTITAFRAAFELGVDLIELDTHITRDGIWIVHHDVNIFGYEIVKYNYEFLNKIAQRIGFELNTLDQVLREFPDRTINIEAKTKTRESGKFLAEKLRMENNWDNYYISSFSRNVLSGARSVSSKIKLSLLGFYLRTITWLKVHQKLELFSVNPYYLFARNGIISKTKAHGLELHTWVPNNYLSITRLIRDKVDVIITDKPLKALRIRSNLISR